MGIGTVLVDLETELVGNKWQRPMVRGRKANEEHRALGVISRREEKPVSKMQKG